MLLLALSCSSPTISVGAADLVYSKDYDSNEDEIDNLTYLRFLGEIPVSNEFSIT